MSGSDFELFLFLGGLLHSAGKEGLLRLSGELTQLNKDLNQSPDSLENLKFVLQKISDIKDMSVDVEMQYRDIQVSGSSGSLGSV